MSIRTYATAVTVASMLTIGVAGAQAVPSNLISVTSNPVTTAVSPGTGVALGTVTFGAPTTGSASIASVPLTLTVGGGGSAGNLSNCQVVNSAGQAVSAAGTVSAGTNTITFLSPANLTSTGGSTTYTIRCDVASGTPSGSIFQFVAGAPTFAPGLMATLATAATAQRGTTAPLAIITLDASRSGQAVNVSTLPLIITAGNGASTADLRNCAVRNTANVGVVLNTGVNAVTTFTNGPTIRLDAPLTVTAGQRVALALTCDVSATTPVGGGFVVALVPSGIGAVNAATGATITPTTGLSSTGTTGSTLGAVTVAGNAGTGTGTGSGTGTGTGTGTPGVPNTGAGDTANLAILVLAALGVIGGLFYIRFAR